LKVGRTLTCHRKAVVIKAKTVTFEVVEAYDCDQGDCAAGNSRWTVLSTAEAGLYLHSVVHEFDYIDPFAASLNAFRLRGELLFGTVVGSATELAVGGVGPHVFDRWCDSRPLQHDIRHTDSPVGQLHSGYDDFDSSWLMQISGSSSSNDICCQQLLVQRFQELEDHSVENVRICSHGLSGSSVGSRYFALEYAKLTSLKQSVRQNWPEFHDADCKLYFVQPQPQDTLRPSWRTCVHIVVEFIDGKSSCPIGVVPVLEESAIWDAHGKTNIRHDACYYSQQLHNRDVVSKFDHLCVRASFRCIVRAEGYRLHPEETTTIVEGAFIQLHALPQVSAPPIEFADYFWHGDHFLETAGNLLGHWVSPQITWSFHVLTGTCRLLVLLPLLDLFISVISQLCTSWASLSTVNNFLAWSGATLVLLLRLSLRWWLPPVSTVGDFCQALDIGDRIPEFSTMAVETDGLQYLLDDRFKPRVGRLYFLRPVHQPAEDEVAFFQREIDKKSFSSVLIDAEHGLCQADGVWTPPTLQARPNQDIRSEFDQDLPINKKNP